MAFRGGRPSRRKSKWGRSVFLIAIAMAIPAFAATGIRPADPVIYMGQAPEADGHTHAILLDADGGAIGLYSNVLRGGPDAGLFDLKQGYRLYCGGWQKRPDQLFIRDRLAESFSYPAPPNPMSSRDVLFRTSRAERSGWPHQMMNGERGYASTPVLPIAKASLTGFRFICAQAHRRIRL